MSTATPNLIAYRKDKLPRRGEMEHRTLGVEELELRQSEHHGTAEDGSEIVLLEFDGYASVFNRTYRVGPYSEEIAPGAFKRSLGNPDLDTALRIEHRGLPIARTSGRVKLADGTEVPTLRLTEDEAGLRVQALLDPTDPDVQRLVPKYRRGDLREMSFGFRVGPNGDEWSEDLSHRTVTAADINRGDVSIVTYGASPTTASSLRSEDLADELRAVGPEGLIGTFRDFAFAWVANHLAAYGTERTVEELEARVGKAISSDSMDTLRRVLALASSADDAVDEAQVILADLMGVTNPDDDEGASDDGEGEGVTSSEQLDHVGRAERNDPTAADYCINADLKQVKLALALAKADQLQDPDLGDDTADADVLAALVEADAAIDRALIAQGQDNQYEDDSDESEDSDMAMLSENGTDLYWRRDFTAKERETAAQSGAAMPDGSYPIRNVTDLRNAIQAFGRAKDPAAVKAHIKKRAAQLDATDQLPEDWRIALMPVHRMNLDEAEFELRTLRSTR